VRATADARRARRSTIGDRVKECNAHGTVLSFVGRLQVLRRAALPDPCRVTAQYYRALPLFIAMARFLPCLAPGRDDGIVRNIVNLNRPLFPFDGEFMNASSTAPDPSAALRVFDAVKALAFIGDLSMGQPTDHSLRTAWLAAQLARAAGTDDATRCAVIEAS
jgi:hypothetical protein